MTVAFQIQPAPTCIAHSIATILTLSARDHIPCSSPAISTLISPPGIHMHACWVLCCKCAHENPARNLNCAACAHPLCIGCWVYYKDNDVSSLSSSLLPLHDDLSTAAPGLMISSAIHPHACFVRCCWCMHENLARNLDCRACPHTLCPNCSVFYGVQKQ